MREWVRNAAFVLTTVAAILLLLILALSAMDLAWGAGTVINGSRTIVGKWDASTATQTLPIKLDSGVPEACTQGEMFWLISETNGRGLYLCVATDTWQALAWGVGTDAPLTCEVGQVFFDSDAQAGENLLACTATDTWTTVGVIQTGWVTGSGVLGGLALWDSTTGITYDSDLNWDGSTRLTVTDLTVTNPIIGSLDGVATSAVAAQYLADTFARWGFRLCGLKFGMFYDEDGDSAVDANDFIVLNDGLDLNGDCTADRIEYVDIGIKEIGAAGAALWFDGGSWVKWDVTAGTAETTPYGGVTNDTNVDSNGDGTIDLYLANVIGGFRGNGSDTQRLGIFPGGYSNDPFDYAGGYVFENTASVEGAFYPIVSDPNYGTLVFAPYSDLGKSAYRWRKLYTKDIDASGNLTVNTATFNQFGYSNSYEANSVFWNSGGGQKWITDKDYDDSATRTYLWGYQTGASTEATMMRLDGDATPEFWLDTDGDGTVEFKYDQSNKQFCIDPDDNANCDFILKDYGTDLAPVVGIAFHGATVPTIVHDDNNKQLGFDLDEDGTPEMTIDGSASQVTLDPNSDGTNDMLLNQTFLQTDQVRYSSTDSARMTATNGRMHMCGGNQFAPNAAAGACMALGGSTGTYATTIYFDPDGDGTSEANINTSGVYSGQATTAGALATDPTGCTNQFVTDMAAAGALTCNSVTGSYITDGSILGADLSWDNTATRTAGQSILVGTDTTKFVTKTETMGAFTFSFSNLPASGTSNMRPAGVYADGFVRWYTTYAITLKGMTCYVNAAKTGGTLAVTVVNAGSNTDITRDTSTTWAANTPYSDTACSSNCNVSADSYVNMTAVTASTFAPTTADLQCQVFYVMQ